LNKNRQIIIVCFIILTISFNGTRLAQRRRHQQRAHEQDSGVEVERIPKGKETQKTARQSVFSVQDCGVVEALLILPPVGGDEQDDKRPGQSAGCLKGPDRIYLQ